MPLSKTAKATRTLTPLEIYFREINRTPLLSAGEEKELALRIQAGDRAARDHMVRANLRLVVRLACRYARRGHCLEDLIAEGNVGLVKAADRYSPDRNTRFSTYAFYWIRLSLQQVVSALRTIRLSNHMNSLVSRWVRTSSALQIELGRPPTEEEVADRLDLPNDRIPAIKHALQMSRQEPMSFEAEGGLSLTDCLLDERTSSPELNASQQELQSRLTALLRNLSAREALVVRLRYGLDGAEAHTLEAIARKLGVTRERVRQLECRALDRMRTQAGAQQ